MTTLSAVKHYMESHPLTTVTDLAVGIETSPDNARQLLEMWRSKKRVRLIPSRCGSCGRGPFGGCNCSEATQIPDVYEWVEQGKDDGPTT